MSKYSNPIPVNESWQSYFFPIQTGSIHLVVSTNRSSSLLPSIFFWIRLIQDEYRVWVHIQIQPILPDRSLLHGGPGAVESTHYMNYAIKRGIFPENM